MKKIFFLFPLILILLFSACRKDEDTSNFVDDNPAPPIIENYSPEVKPVTSSVAGEVKDENQEPVQNAIVRLGNFTTSTDKYGLFSFENISMNEKGTFITVQQEGFLDGSRRFFPRENTQSKIVIEMITENYRPSFEAATGGTVTIDGTTGVAFTPNSIVKANGEVYDGEVYVTHAYLDPTANTTADQMPGALQGVRTDLEEVSLQSFGMINVSLQDIGGAPLNIGEGFTATISVALPTSIAANAPNEIPLWSFNETFGIWVEEGSATKVNGVYVGEVEHFSWWNCDAPFPLIELDLTLVDENENPLSYHSITITLGSNNLSTRYAYTNLDGFTSGKVPANESLLLEIIGICGDVIFSTSIGPFSEDTSLGLLSIEDPNVNNTDIIGSLVDCDNNPVTNGAIIVTIEDIQYITFVDDGNFSFSLSTCDGSTDLTVKGVDLDGQFESDPPINGMVGTTFNTGEIEVCNNPITQSIMTINVGSETYEYNSITGNLTGGVTANGTILVEYSPQDSLGQETYIALRALGTTADNYDDNNNCTMFNYSTIDMDFDLRPLEPNSAGINFADFTISTLTPNLTGNFSDTLINTAGGNQDTVFVSGNFTIIQ